MYLLAGVIISDICKFSHENKNGNNFVPFEPCHAKDTKMTSDSDDAALVTIAKSSLFYYDRMTRTYY